MGIHRAEQQQALEDPVKVTEGVNLLGSPLTPPLYSFVLGEVTPSFKLPL